MSARLRLPKLRGQAAVEGLLALTLLGIFLHSVIDLGSWVHQAQDVAQLSRVAAFTGGMPASGARTGHAPELTVAVGPTTPASPCSRSQSSRAVAGEANERMAGRIGEASADMLARDWLGGDLALRCATGTATATARHGSAQILPSIQRQTVVAVFTGARPSDSDVASRLKASPTGWSDAAQQSSSVVNGSAPLATSLIKQLEHLAAPGKPLGWSEEWVEAWQDLPTLVPRVVQPNHEKVTQ